MTRLTLRFGACAITLLATASLFFAHATVAPIQLAAAACCIQCENAEAAGYAACAQAEHTACDGLQDCYNAVDAWNWNYCWAHCSYTYCTGGCEYFFTCHDLHNPAGHLLQSCGYVC